MRRTEADRGHREIQSESERSSSLSQIGEARNLRHCCCIGCYLPACAFAPLPPPPDCLSSSCPHVRSRGRPPTCAMRCSGASAPTAAAFGCAASIRAHSVVWPPSACQCQTTTPFASSRWDCLPTLPCWCVRASLGEFMRSAGRLGSLLGVANACVLTAGAEPRTSSCSGRVFASCRCFAQFALLGSLALPTLCSTPRRPACLRACPCALCPIGNVCVYAATCVEWQLELVWQQDHVASEFVSLGARQAAPATASQLLGACSCRDGPNLTAWVHIAPPINERFVGSTACLFVAFSV